MTDVDPPLMRLARDVVKPGSVVWDVGANLGLFAFAAAVAAGPSGEVLAVEPDAFLVGMLRRSAAVNRGCAPVRVLPAAVAGQVSVARFAIAKRNRATNHLDGFGTSQTGGVRAEESVVTVTLDWLSGHFRQPDVLKIDVEEAESEVLTGGQHVLTGAPTVICEVAAQNATTVHDILHDHGYTLYDGDADPPLLAVPPTAPLNTLALPARSQPGSSGAPQHLTGTSAPAD